MEVGDQRLALESDEVDPVQNADDHGDGEQGQCGGQEHTDLSGVRAVHESPRVWRCGDGGPYRRQAARLYRMLPEQVAAWLGLKGAGGLRFTVTGRWICRRA